jgi:hypothetical protein
MGNQVIPQELN